ncbi:MAG TPA: winged helix-turn-helix domain-containing protein [Stellaceae bacterium]|nr:winged helix-turn-helix domain-containing protein [Stellaceae bacterium]
MGVVAISDARELDGRLATAAPDVVQLDLPSSTGEAPGLLRLITLTREYLIQATRVHEDCGSRNIDVRVVRLRRKLENGRGAACLIRTERGAGYRLDMPVETVAG